MSGKFTRERVRFHMKKKDTLVIQGWIENDAAGDARFEAWMDKKKLPVEVRTQRGVEVTKKYLRYKTNVPLEYFIEISLPQGYGWAGRLEVNQVLLDQGERPRIYAATGAALVKLSHHMDSWMESLSVQPDGRYLLRGWYIGCENAKVALLDSQGRVVRAEYTSGHRMDIQGEYPEAQLEETHSFELVFPKPKENQLRLEIWGGSRSASYTVNCAKMLSGREDLLNVMKKGWMYFQRKGAKQFAKRVSDAVLSIDSVSYDKWRKKYGTTSQELVGQRHCTFIWEPKISILVPLYYTPEKYLREMIASVEAQTYRNWELVLSDGSGAESPLDPLLDEYEQKDDRIRVLRARRRLRIAQNTNEAMRAASGDFFLFGDHDDLLAPDALFACVSLINARQDVELIYSDEDKVDSAGRKYFEPHFKSDYNPELLCSMNYFCHLVMVKRELCRRVGFLDSAFEGAQDYDYVLRCTEQTTPERIGHVPKILYHWRAHGGSTSENPKSKQYAFDAGRRAVQAHYDRLGIRARVLEGEYPGLYRTEFEIAGEPLISILIPNKDHAKDLLKCIHSIEKKSDYRNYEFIVIENNSTDPETFKMYRRLERDNHKVQVVCYDNPGGFNYSAVNNFGAAYAKGEYLLLLNNDTEIINPDCLRQLLGYCQLEEVGAVGARLYYEDGVIQHAGVVLGFGGIAGHAFIGQKRGDNGYFSRIICAQDYSAVTAACMMVKTSVFRAVGGMSEDLAVAFNDIDFCMKVRRYGKRIVYNPYAELYHYESRSRGPEDTQEKIERFNRETALFLSRWGEQVKAGDPYYNPNLTLDKADFSLKV